MKFIYHGLNKSLNGCIYLEIFLAQWAHFCFFFSMIEVFNATQKWSWQEQVSSVMSKDKSSDKLTYIRTGQQCHV